MTADKSYYTSGNDPTVSQTDTNRKQYFKKVLSSAQPNQLTSQGHCIFQVPSVQSYVLRNSTFWLSTNKRY